MENIEKEVSCYSSSLLIDYALKEGISDSRLFEGIEKYKENLKNPLEWTDQGIWMKLAINIEKAFSVQGILEDIGKKITKSQISNFQLLFLKIAPISSIIKNISRQAENNISKVTRITAKLINKGEADVFFEPIDSIKSLTFLAQGCDFNKGCTFATFQQKGYKDLKITEVTCAARNKTAKACHYKLTWTPQSNIIKKIKNFLFFRFRDQKSIISHMEESHKKLQDQYSEINQLYEKLVKSESKFRTIFENIQDVYFEIDLNGKILEISPSVSSVSFYNREELLYTNFKDICLNVKDAEDKIKQLETSDRISDYELQIKNKDGNVIFCTITARLIKEENEEHKITGVLRDSTERKKAEEEKQILQEQLRRSEQLKSLGQLAGGIAHDFKNQLFGIAANAHAIKKSIKDNENIKTSAENIIKSAHRSSDLTKQLLAFARKGKYQSVAIDLHSVVNDIVMLLKRTIDKKIHIGTQLSAKTPVVSGDPGQIENALLNVVFNARDAMPKGGNLTFASSNILLDEDYCSGSEFDIASGQYVRIVIKDTGHGIDEEKVKYVFDPFFTTKEMGNGLGLSAVYGTIKEHGGAVSIDTEVGTGTEISIYLPVSSTKKPKKEKTREMKKLTSSRNILIVEDEEIVRNSAKDALEELGFKVTAFPDGSSALKHYKKLSSIIDLILLDMILPDYDVKDLFSELQKINPSAKIILWSAYTLPDTVQSLREKGAVDFIDKGSNIVEFTRKISGIAEGLS